MFASVKQFTVNACHDSTAKRIDWTNVIVPLSNLNRMKITKCHLLIFHSFAFAWIGLVRLQLSCAYCKYSKHMVNVRIGIFSMLLHAAANCGLWHVGNSFVLCVTYINNFEVISIACAAQMKTRAQLDSFRLCYCGCCCFFEWRHSHEHFIKPHTQNEAKKKMNKKRTNNNNVSGSTPSSIIVDSCEWCANLRAPVWDLRKSMCGKSRLQITIMRVCECISIRCLEMSLRWIIVRPVVVVVVAVHTKSLAQN